MLKKGGDIVQKEGVKAVLFDLDGVLVDSFEAWFHTFNDSLKHFGLRALSKAKFSKQWGGPIERDIKKYFIGRTVEEVKNTHNTNFMKWKSHVELFPQSTNVLQKLKKQNRKLGLITNSSKLITSMILNHHGLKKYFQVIITMDDVKRRKPAPDMILKACKMLKVKPKNTILIGDTKNDMIAGKRTGCVTVGYKVKGDYKIKSLNSITRFLNQNQNRT
ncbi:HAD family hydrolase [Candidatus Woesearchaeota archaeon]|nr:HAD family hydrolase [Candidatus Woesearchaeota archaeon]